MESGNMKMYGENKLIKKKIVDRNENKNNFMQNFKQSEGIKSHN